MLERKCKWRLKFFDIILIYAFLGCIEGNRSLVGLLFISRIKMDFAMKVCLPLFALLKPIKILKK
jgi:hypothetical protein